MKEQTEQQQQQQQRKVLVNIAGRGSFTLPLVEEHDKGYVCRTGPNDSPATEWFAKDSKLVTAREI